MKSPSNLALKLKKNNNVQFQEISILPPQKGLEFPGAGGFCKAKKLKEMYEE